MVEFLEAVVGALAVAGPVAKNLGDLAKGGRQIVNVAGDILDRFR